MARSAVKHQPTDDHARNYAQIAYEFARDAAGDKKGLRHCKWVRLAAQRHLDDLKASRKKAYPHRFDAWHANDVCDFAEKMPHVEGTWDTPTITLEPVQVFILATVFGWRRKDTGLRRFTSVYIEMARKGAKSTLTAVVALYCLTCEDEVGPQILIGASTGDQAKKVFNPAKAMADRLPDFREAFRVETWSRSITSKVSGGYIQPVNAKSSTQDGHNPHVGILDELHAHKDRGLYDVIKSAFGARKNPLLWVITTAGYDTQGVCFEQHRLVKQILEGVVDADHYFGVIFTLDEGDDEYDETKWIKANPMLGVTPTLESMQTYAAEAKAAPGVAFEFKTKRLNMWTTAIGGWLNMETWKANNAKPDFAELAGAPCFGGLDLAAVSDITAFVLVWIVDGRLKIKGRYYLPRDTITEHVKRRNVPYAIWERRGFLTVTPGNATDYGFIERDVKAAMAQYDVKAIGFDPWNATQVVNNLMTEGAPMIEMRQGAKTFNQPMRELERLLKLRQVDHGNDPVLNWMASNIVPRFDANENMAPDKKNSGEKIDGIVALLMALNAALGQEETKSIYEQRPMLSLGVN